MTIHLLASIQSLMLAMDTIGHQASPLYQRAKCAEAYLIERYNRDLSPEEAEVFDLVLEGA